MDTKERKPAQRRRKPSQGQRRTRPAVGNQARRANPQADRRTAAAKRNQRPAAKSRHRVVKPPREDIPEVVYTMPQPLHRGKFLLRLLSVAAVVAALMMAVSIFFRVDTVEVLGAEKYTAWDVSQASGVQVGDGLLTLSQARVAGKIRAALPYVDEVKLRVTLPGTVRIEIRELQVTYAILSQDNTWWLIGVDGTAIEAIGATAALDYTQVQGVTVEAPRVGMTVIAQPEQTPQPESSEETGESESGSVEPTQALDLFTQPVQTNAQRLEAALEILQSLERNGVIGQVAAVDVTSVTEIQLQYGQRFRVILGGMEDLDYKIRYMRQAISQMEDYQTGELDVSFEYAQEAIFTPEA